MNNQKNIFVCQTKDQIHRNNIWQLFTVCIVMPLRQDIIYRYKPIKTRMHPISLDSLQVCTWWRTYYEWLPLKKKIGLQLISSVDCNSQSQFYILCLSSILWHKMSSDGNDRPRVISECHEGKTVNYFALLGR